MEDIRKLNVYCSVKIRLYGRHALKDTPTLRITYHSFFFFIKFMTNFLNSVLN